MPIEAETRTSRVLSQVRNLPRGAGQDQLPQDRQEWKCHLIAMGFKKLHLGAAAYPIENEIPFTATASTSTLASVHLVTGHPPPPPPEVEAGQDRAWQTLRAQAYLFIRKQQQMFFVVGGCCVWKKRIVTHLPF